MKYRSFASKLTLGAVAFLTAFCLVSPPARSVTIGESAPDFSLPTLDGQKVNLGEFKGKVVLLNFWASWCESCKEELPEFEKLNQKYRSRGFETIGVNIDLQRANAERFVQRFGLGFKVLLDPDTRVIASYGGHAMPISYLIDRDGIVRQVFFGFSRARLPQMESSIDGLLGAGN